MKNPSLNASVEESQAGAEYRHKKGEFVRGISGFRSILGDKDFPAEPGVITCLWR